MKPNKLTLSELRHRINDFNNAPGVGFDPRVIVMSFENYEALREEINFFLRSTIDSRTNEMTIAGIKIVHESQALVIK
jgi:hypothetical protein